MMGKSSTGLDENVAGLLCYLGAWVTGIIFMVIEKSSKFVKFHAWQSLITFAAINILMIICSILGFIPYIGWIFGIVSWLLWILYIVLWIIGMIKAYQGKMFKWPVVGDIAEKQAK
jgi:uncharacterized membrane protein